MLHINSSVIINRPVEEVFALAGNSNNDPIWWDGVITSEYGSEITEGVGTIYVQVNHYMGRTVNVSFETTGYEKNRMVSHRSLSGPMVFTTKMLFEPVDGNATKMTFLAEVDVTGLFKLLQPLFNRMMSQRTDANLLKLKRIMEQSQPAAV